MCGLQLRLAPAPLPGFWWSPDCHLLPFQVFQHFGVGSVSTALLLWRYPPWGGGDNPPGLRCCRLLTCGPSSSVWLILRSGWVLAPRHRGVHKDYIGSTAYVKSNLGTGFGSGFGSCAIWPKSGGFGAIRAKPARSTTGGTVRHPDLPLTGTAPGGLCYTPLV